MVDTVRNSPNTGTSTVHDQAKSRVSQLEQAHTSQVEKASASTPSISVDLSITEKVKSLAAEPPINIEVVNEIKQKVSEGRYPIDLNAISNKLFESIKEGEG